MTQGSRGGSSAPAAPPEAADQDAERATGPDGSDSSGSGRANVENGTWGAATTTATTSYQGSGGVSPDTPTGSLPTQPDAGPAAQPDGRARTREPHGAPGHDARQQNVPPQAPHQQRATQAPPPAAAQQGPHQQPGQAPGGQAPGQQSLGAQGLSQQEPHQQPGPHGPAQQSGAQQPGATAPAREQGNRRTSGATRRGPRRARLQLRHVDPWTVLKFSCVLSVALLFVWLIVIGVLFGILDGAGIIGKINDTYTTLQGGNAQSPVTAGVVFGGAAIVGVVNIVLFIALSTIGSIIYNLCADLVGGVEVTLSER